MLNIRNFDGIESFLEVCRNGNFSAAAKKLNLSKNSVSRNIALLEQHVGQKLFRRTTRQVQLTQFGEVFREKAEVLAEELHRLNALCSSQSTKPMGKLRILASGAFAPKFLYPRLPEFKKQYPELSLEIQIDESENWNLNSDGIEVIFGFTHTPQFTEAWRFRKLLTIRHLLVASPSFLRQCSAITTPHDLLLYPYLNHSARGSKNAFTLQDGSEVRIPSAEIIVDNFEHLIELAIKGLGIILTAKELVRDEIAQKRLVPVLPHLNYCHFDIGLFCRPDEIKLPKIRAFMDFKWIL